ncbi:MAG TPA: histidine kinase [Cryomorphaceae bacterium]|nr:histidine kinase [Owenweeksia sp.]HAD95980.1 histidine kinase [Cryomorphaceae bacterium]HBF20356.1 histidine kinase [Cryomorphaceae bacterium]|tara:strand:- start:15546 stop:16607 length:1062 start_codon:yes stop_codon:yes gene_type:complete
MRFNESLRSFREFVNYIVINTVIALAITFFFCASCFLDPQEWTYAGRLWLYSFLISLALSGGIGALDARINRSLPWHKAPLKRFLLELLTVTVYSFVACFVVVFLFHWVLGNFTLDSIPWEDLTEQTYRPVIIAYIITSFFVSRSFLMEWRQAAVDAEKLRSERFAGQYQVLKDQLNPHFLFNSLNALSNVVHEDQEKAVQFIQQLSRFYRYILDVQHEEVVSLQQELDFAQRYLYLQSLRFEDKLQSEIDVRVQEEDCIPPLAIQICLENVIKHNEISKDHSLKVIIRRESDRLCICNNLQVKNNRVPEPSGIGLTNIRERYRMLSGREVEVEKSQTEFRVYLPILKLGQSL